MVLQSSPRPFRYTLELQLKQKRFSTMIKQLTLSSVRWGLWLLCGVWSIANLWGYQNASFSTRFHATNSILQSLDDVLVALHAQSSCQCAVSKIHSAMQTPWDSLE